MNQNSETKQREVGRLFDQLAPGYDRAALRFFPFAADRLAALVAPRPGEKILDVATGTGAVAVALAQRLRGGGRVMAVDISERMLDQAYANVRRMALGNIDLHPMDGAALEFRDGYFDAVTCSFGLFFMPDMGAALREWRRVLRPGGRLWLTAFGPQAFQPLVNWFCEALAAAGGPELESARDFDWQRLATAKQVMAQFADAGFVPGTCETEQLGYHLQSPGDWWEIVWNTGFRGYLASFDAAALEGFQESHLTAVAKHFVDAGLWMEVPVLFASAQVPG